MRLRRLQLRALGYSDADLAPSSAKLWPMSCKDNAVSAAAALKDSSTEQSQKSLSDLIAFLAQPSAIWRDGTSVVVPALATLDAAAAGTVAPGKDPLPPTALNLDTLGAIGALTKKGASFSQTYTEDNPVLSLPVLIDDQDLPAPLLCAFSKEAAQCRALTELSAVHGHGLRLLGTSDADTPPLIFAGKHGAEGVFVAGSGTPVDRMYSFGGYSAHDGSSAVLGWDEEGGNLVLSQKPSAQAAAVRTPLKPNFRVSNFFYSSHLLWDQVLVRGVTPENERRLFVMPLGHDTKAGFGLIDIGELPEVGLIRAGEEEQPHLTGCRTQQATVVRDKGEDNDFLTFRIHDTFTRLVVAPAFGTLGCYGTTATFVRAQMVHTGALRLEHSACTSAGCTPIVLQGEALDRNTSELRPREASDVAAVDLAGKLVVVWRAGEHGGLRLRVAEPETFDRGSDVVLFDDHVADGKVVPVSTILGFRLYSREHFAVLLLSTLAGVHAFRIDRTANSRPGT